MLHELADRENFYVAPLTYWKPAGILANMKDKLLHILKPEVDQTLYEIRNQGTVPWTWLALVLMTIQFGAWPFEEFSSFNSWLNAHAKDFGIGVRMLRNYVWAAQYYMEELRPKLIKWDLTAPLFEELPQYIGPDTLIEMRKVSRFEDEELERSCAERVMDGTYKRNDIRMVWVAGRKTIKSDPHRSGRIPYSDFERHEQSEAALFEAVVVNALLKHRGIFQPDGTLIDCSLIQDIQSISHITQLPDFVVACKESDNLLSLHAIEAKIKVPEKLDTLQSWLPYFDKIWLILPKGQAEIAKNIKREGIGILTVADGKIFVLYESTTCTQLGRATDILLRSILAKKYW